MDSQNTIVFASLLDPNHGIGQKPVMRMNEVEMANKVFNLKKAVNEGPTHVVDIVHKIIMRQVYAPMVVDAIYAIVASLAMHSPSENVHPMAFSCESSSQFAHMDRYASNSDRMKRLPRQHRDSHRCPFLFFF
jgi:hypothetical protein